MMNKLFVKHIIGMGCASWIDDLASNKATIDSVKTCTRLKNETVESNNMPLQSTGLGWDTVEVQDLLKAPI